MNLLDAEAVGFQQQDGKEPSLASHALGVTLSNAARWCSLV